MAKWYKELDNNRVRLFVEIWQNGKRKAKSRIIKVPKGKKSLREYYIQENLTKLESELEKQFCLNANSVNIAPLKDYINEWLRYNKGNWQPSTYDFYKDICQNHIIKYFKSVWVAEIKPLDIKKFYAHLQDSGYSDKTVLHVHKTLKQILDESVIDGIITVDQNPIFGIKAPKVVRSETEAYHLSELPKVIEYIETEPLIHQCVFYLALMGGLRRAEICGLNDDDINTGLSPLKNILIKRNYITTSSGNVLKTPKNEKSRLITSLPEEIFQKLLTFRDQKNALHLARKEEEHKNALFIQADGKRIYPTTPTAWWRKF